MTDRTPRVSIGLPVFNGENYLADALQSLIDQSYADVEIVVSDNASTDRTEEICRRFAAIDSRIRYHRQAQNLGAARNYNAVFAESRGNLFKWAAHDDICHPDFIMECVKALDEDPSAVLAYPLHHIINGSGATIGEGASCPDLSSSERPVRLKAALAPDETLGEPPWSVFGLMRRDALLKTRLHGSYVGSDRILMAELALLGPFSEVSERLFLNREHGDRSIRMPTSDGFHPRTSWFDSSQVGKRVMPNWRRLKELIAAVLRTPMGLCERLSCLGVVAGWLRGGIWKRLLRDLGAVVVMTFRLDKRPR